MKARPAASGLIVHEAMEKVVELPNWAALMDYLKKNYEEWGPDEKNVTIHFYAEDKRIGWKTHMVCVKGNAALFTDGIPEDAPQENQRDPHAQLPNAEQTEAIAEAGAREITR